LGDANPIRYEPQEPAPHPLAAGLGAQIVTLMATGVMVSPLVVARGAGLDAAATSWLVFAALLAAGLSTWLQAMQLGRVGGGHTLFVGSNVAFVGICVSAIQAGGLGLMAALVCVSSLSTFAFTYKLGALRRVLTPAVGGTVLMLMSLSVAPVAWGMLKKVPTEFLEGPAPIVAGATFLVILLVSLFARGMLRLWAPILGVVIGSAMSGIYGMVDVSKVAEAAWLGLPAGQWPGISLDLGPSFWGLLPAFLLVSLVGCIETYADGISVQRSSYRRPRPVDYRAVQGAINADGVGSFFAGALGTIPNTVYSMSVGVMELTRVASRRVAYWGGLFLILLAFSPKVSALVAAIPGPVAAAYILMILVILFGHGMQMVYEDSLGFEAGLAVCVGFWVGMGFQGGFLFNDLAPKWAQMFLSNGTTSGGITTLLIMALLQLRSGPSDRFAASLEPASADRLRALVERFAASLSWDKHARGRLEMIVHEAFLFLLKAGMGRNAATPRQFKVRLRQVGEQVEIEFVCAPAASNIEAAISDLPPDMAPASEDDLSLLLLRGLAREVRHMQYHGVDYLIIKADATPPNND
jgi:NCS2 family nucleobase:cation symporter-2/xanthine permease XanP